MVAPIRESAAARRLTGPADTPIVIGVAALGALLVAASVLVALRGGMPAPERLALRNALMIGAPVAVGLYAWREATHARFGRLLVAVGMGWGVAPCAPPRPRSLQRRPHGGLGGRDRARLPDARRSPRDDCPADRTACSSERSWRS